MVQDMTDEGPTRGMPTNGIGMFCDWLNHTVALGQKPPTQAPISEFRYRPPARPPRPEWSAAEIARLKELWPTNMLRWHLAEVLGKSPQACRNKARRLGLKDRFQTKAKRKVPFAGFDRLEIGFTKPGLRY